MYRTLLIACFCIYATAVETLAQSDTQRLRQALELQQAGKWQQARQVLGSLEHAEMPAPLLGRLLFLRARLALLLQEPEAALPDLAQVLHTYPPLADYAGWAMVQYFAAQDRLDHLQATLTVLSTHYPFSLLLPDCRLLLARTQWRLGQPAAAQVTLEQLLQTADSSPLIPEALFFLAQLYEEAGQILPAANTLQRLGESYPTHTLATEALQRSAQFLAQLPPEQRPVPTPDQLLVRLDGLIQARQWQEVERRLTLLEALEQPPSLAVRVLLTRATVALRRRQLEPAQATLRTLLQHYPHGEHTAEARYLLGQVEQLQKKPAEGERQYRLVLAEHATSRWAADAMWALAQRLEDRQHSAEASALYQRLAGAFPTHEKAEDSLWQAGWLQYGQQRYAAAAEIFRRFEAQFPRSELLPQVLYWQARAVHHHGQPRSAERLYRRLVVDYPFHYYSLHAAERLRQAASSAPLPAEPPPLITVWAHPQPVHLPEPSSAPPSEPQFHLLRIRELQQLWMYQEAAREIRRLGTLLPDIPAARYLLGVLFVDNRQYLAAFRLLSSLLKDLRPEEVRGLPREFWTMLYPKAFWDNVARHAQGSGVDPYLILSIMRQESAFEPTAVSSAGARGLMQLMPETARLVSNRLNLRQATTSALEVPTLNIALGTHYFASLLQRYQGNVVLALAAYNAGPGRADRWHKQWQHLPMDEFVEQLPWRETRLYVKLVLRNLRNYERLYKALQDS